MARRQPINNKVRNGDFLDAPTFTAATNTSGRWIDGTAAGSTTNDIYKWAIGSRGGTSTARFIDGTMMLSLGASNSTMEVWPYTSTTRLNIMQYLPLMVEGSTYRLTYKMKTNYVSGDGTGARVVVIPRSSLPGSTTSQFGTAVKTTTDWTEYTITSTVPVGFPYLMVQMRITGTGATNDLIMDAWFKDVVLDYVPSTARTTVTSRSALSRPRLAVRDMGTALRFDGVDDYVEVPDVNLPASTFTGGFTLSVLVKHFNLGESNNGRLFDKSDGVGVGGEGGFILRMANATPSGFLMSINAGTGRQTQAVLPVRNTTTYYLATFSVSSDGIITPYLNGQASGTPGTSGALSAITTTRPLRIGNRSDATDRSFNGILDEARIWNRALTATEIQNLYLYNDVPRSGLVAEYLFNEGSGTTATDSSGNGNNGTITGATYVTDAPLKTRAVV